MLYFFPFSLCPCYVTCVISLHRMAHKIHFQDTKIFDPMLDAWEHLIYVSLVSLCLLPAFLSHCVWCVCVLTVFAPLVQVVYVSCVCVFVCVSAREYVSVDGCWIFLYLNKSQQVCIAIVYLANKEPPVETQLTTLLSINLTSSLTDDLLQRKFIHFLYFCPFNLCLCVISLVYCVFLCLSHSLQVRSGCVLLKPKGLPPHVDVVQIE